MKLLLLVGVVVAVADLGDAASMRIARDVKTTLSEHPYICSLQLAFITTYFHTCGAVVYNNKTIITAAHCVDSPGTRRVQCGLHRLNDQNNFQATVAINRCKVVRNAGPKHEHSNPDGAGYPNDLAVCELATPLTFNDYVSAIDIDIDIDTASSARQDCKLAGWGKNVDVGSLPHHLQTVSMTEITNSRCWTLWQSVRGAAIYDTNICFFDEPGQEKQACRGDSGGPVRCSRDGRNVLTGITSWGISTCSDDYPSVYTRVSKYADWLQTNAYA